MNLDWGAHNEIVWECFFGGAGQVDRVATRAWAPKRQTPPTIQNGVYLTEGPPQLQNVSVDA